MVEEGFTTLEEVAYVPLEEMTAIEGFDDDTGSTHSLGDPGEDHLPPLLTGAETGAVVSGLREVLAEFEAPDFVIHTAGSPVMLQTIAGAMAHDMPRFVGLAIASIAIFLFLLFRRVIAVVIPLVVVALSVASTGGLMGWSGVPIHVPTQILPSFLLAVSVGDAVHLLAIFFEQIRVGQQREDALCYALGHSGLALVLTSLTTAAGLMSFSTSPIEPVAMLGIFAPTGVMVALFLSLTMLPALEVVASVLENAHYKEQMDEVRAGVRRGRELSTPLQETGLFPPLMIQMIDLGQKSGEIEDMMIRVSETYDEDVRLTIDALVGLMEPIIIIVMGVFVGLLVTAILLPILDMSKNL